jgi:predicted RNA binding protein YcfA (HicA-like mRNA interferase family)
VIGVREQRGWVVDRQSGSHVTLKKVDVREIITVPVHGHDPIPIDTLPRILRTASIDPAELR